MNEVVFSKFARADLEQLKRWRRPYAKEVVRIIREELRVDGCVSDVYEPHVLGNGDEFGAGYMEFHAFPDVLVLYYPVKPNGFIRIHHVCTHEALRTGDYDHMWPTGNR